MPIPRKGASSGVTKSTPPYEGHQGGGDRACPGEPDTERPSSATWSSSSATSETKWRRSTTIEVRIPVTCAIAAMCRVGEVVVVRSGPRPEATAVASAAAPRPRSRCGRAGPRRRARSARCPGSEREQDAEPEVGEERHAQRSDGPNAARRCSCARRSFPCSGAAARERSTTRRARLERRPPQGRQKSSRHRRAAVRRRGRFPPLARADSQSRPGSAGCGSAG